MRGFIASLLLPIMLWSGRSGAELPPGSDLGGETEPVETEPVELMVPAIKAPPAPYSLPWGLRPAVAATAVRLDTSFALQHRSTTAVTLVSGSLAVAPDVAIAVRYGWVYDAPTGGPARSAFTDVALGGTYAPALTDVFRLAVSAGLVLPVAQGGGVAPADDAKKAILAGAYARSAMDNAMFGANELGLFTGAALACVEGGWTLQLEATFFQLFRVRGAASQPDALKTNSTWGIHAGYFLTPHLSASAELRYQVFLVPPRSVASDPPRRDTATAALGLRAHFKGSFAFRPGLAYVQPLDDPMAAAGYRIVQIDLPFIF